MSDRTLIYTWCDTNYSVFIPIFCASLLSTNKNIDIEIGTSLQQLSNEQSEALDKLRKLHPDAQILIRTGMYKEEGSKRVILDNGVSVQSATVRFITEPQIKDKYTYISDIDIVSLDKDFYESHIADMKEHNRTYSNIVRKHTTPRLSGLHFCETKYQYPLDLRDVDITGWNEVILMQVTEKRQKLDYETEWRPVHGVHMSANRPRVEGTADIPGWFPKEWDYCEDKDNYKKKWFEFKKSPEYDSIVPTIENNIVGKLIQSLENYYHYRYYLEFRKWIISKSSWLYGKITRKIKRTFHL